MNSLLPRGAAEASASALRRPMASPQLRLSAGDALNAPVPKRPRAQRPKAISAQRLDAEDLLKLLEAHELEVFRTPDGAPYFSLTIKGVTQAAPLSNLRAVVRRVAYATKGVGVPSSVLEEVGGLLEGRSFEMKRTVWVRVASTPGHVFIDLADGTGRAIEIDAQGWRLNPKPAVTFFRPDTLKPLPVPVRGRGSLEALRAFLHLAASDWRTVLAFLITTVMPPELDGGDPCPRALLLLTGEHQAGKTTRAEKLASIIDPRTALSSGMPETSRELAIHAQNRWVLLFDNLSGSPPLSDALCRLLDGTGFTTRALYTNAGEAVFSGSRPIIITGIDAAPNRGDLASRCLHIELPPLPAEARATPDELADRFAQFHPGALAELCDLAVVALAGRARSYRPTTRLSQAEKWVAACEEALGWEQGAAAKLFEHHARVGVETAAEADGVAQAIIDYLERQHTFEGNAKRLLKLLDEQRTGRTPQGWPETPKALSSRLRRSLPGLRARGIEFSGPDPRRIFRLTLSTVMEDGQ